MHTEHLWQDIPTPSQFVCAPPPPLPLPPMLQTHQPLVQQQPMYSYTHQMSIQTPFPVPGVFVPPHGIQQQSGYYSFAPPALHTLYPGQVQTASQESSRQPLSHSSTPAPQAPIPTKQVYYCEPCDKEFNSLSSFDAHKATHEACKHPGCVFTGSKKVHTLIVQQTLIT